MVEVLERGDIHFFFRPTVQPADALETQLGVQAFFMLLSPAGGRHRRVRVGRKRMPSPRGERFWAVVERVGSFDRVIGDQLSDAFYSTKTRGSRYQPAARPVAHGTYAIVRHDDHAHLAYRISETEPAFDVPSEIQPPRAGSCVLLWKRLPRNSNRGPQWTTAGDPHRLDHQGEELVLVGADSEPERELGIDLA